MSSHIYHYHHIIPKHMGGTDDPSNLIKLTVKEHAEAHLALWMKYQKREDLIAYRALNGSIGKEEMIYELAKLGSQKGALNGGLSCRDKQVGIHDPNRKHLKSEGGKKGYHVLEVFYKEKSVWVKKDQIDKRILLEKLDEYLLAGWERGRNFSPNKGKEGKTKNTIWINDGNKNKRIKRDQLEEYPNWSLGMI